MVSKNSALKKLVVLMRFSRLRALQRVLISRARVCLHAAYSENPRTTETLLVGELSDSRSIERSGLLIEMIIDVAVRSPGATPVFDSFFEGFPGKNTLEKVRVCQRAMHRCFAKALFRSELSFALAPPHREVYPNSSSRSVPRTLELDILYEQHDDALARWFNQHGTPSCADENDKRRFAALLEQSAREGSKDAMYLLAIAYSDGFGVPKSFAASINWLEKAANSGNADAQSTLGVAYCIGFMVAKDESVGREFLRMASRQGNKVAREALQRLQFQNSENGNGQN